ncbi:MAG: hypothetical protein A2Z83_09300 [Omnitrophica bacterium GWA2_52_8]|nr:MAG: hypothetical protein A2Z83_09300 [Omnitrophica bacterium GWA2_52_8]
MSEQLIYAMSTRTELRIEQFNDIFKKVSLPGELDKDETIDFDVRRHVIRALDALGYCEFDFDDRMVYMCPPAFVLLPTHGLPKAVLTGARSPRLMALLKEAVKKRIGKARMVLDTSRRNVATIPASVHVETADQQTLAEIANDLHIQCEIDQPAAWLLALCSAPVSEIERGLTFEQKGEPDWQRRVFDVSHLGFSKKADISNSGLSLAEYKHPVTQQRMHWLWKEGKVAGVQRDWGRYVILSHMQSQILLYDENTYALAAPLTLPLPCLMARALALCSGFPPVIEQTKIAAGAVPAGHKMQIYLNVTPDIATLVAEKLGQKLIACSLAVDEDEVIRD